MNPKVLLEALNDRKVDYVLVGGLAAAVHGTSRVTKDIDLAYSRSAGNLQPLCDVINRFEPRRMILGKPEGGVFALTPQILRSQRIIQLTTSVGQIDLLDKIEGFATYGLIKKYAETQRVGVDAIVLSVEGLIRAKEAMKRPKDIQDLVELRALQEAQSHSGVGDGGLMRIKGPSRS